MWTFRIAALIGQLSNPKISVPIGLVGGLPLWSFLHWFINRHRVQKRFSLTYREENISIANGGQRFELQHLQFFLNAEENFNMITAYIKLPYIKCTTPPIMLRHGENNSIRINTASLPLRENAQFSLILIFKDQDGDWYRYEQPMIIHEFGTRYDLNSNGTGQRRKIGFFEKFFIKNKFL